MSAIAFDGIALTLVILVVSLSLVFDRIEEEQNFENICQRNGFQNKISKQVGFASSKEYCVDSNGKLIEVICDTDSCYFLEDTK